ncbi:hypothetical protein U2150_07775 [Methanothermobacter wolfeii]|uniref:Uncharacterized protein n=1 Tax=Methanothermobacter wolfeii TaxID=145261 RepID=A0ABU8TWF9_METWO
MVDGVYNDSGTLYDYYESTRKIRLKGIKFFSPPLPAVDLRKNLSFLNGNRYSSALKSEYREISEADFKRIYSRANFVKNFPLYLENVSFNIDEFILNSINSLHGIIKRFDNRKQMDIKTFIRLLGEFMDSYGVSKSYDELEEFYSLNAWRTGIKHYPSRDPERIVTLYNSQGGKRDFGLISFE